MASYFLSPIGNDAPFMRNGVPASGCKLFTYVAGSTTKQNTYTDNTGNTANANPIILNQEGYPASGGNVISIWLTQGATYKFVLAPSTDTDPPSSPIWSRDNISGENDVTLSQSEWVAGPTPTFVSSTQFTLVGDQTSNFHVGRRVKYTVTAGTGYATITASSFAAVTTVTVDSQGSNALDSGLSAVSYSLLRADNFTQSLGLDAITRYATAIAAAATLNLNAVGGDHVHISSATSTTTITAVTLSQGHDRTVTFDSPQILTSNSSFIVPTGTLTASTGDNIRLRGEPSNVVRTVDYQRSAGFPLQYAWALLDTKTASNSASLDFVTGINSTYDEYELHFVDVIPATNAVTLFIRVSEDGGSTFKAGATDYRAATDTINGAGTAGTVTGSQSGIVVVSGANGQRNGVNGLHGVVKFYKPSGTTQVKVFLGQSACEEATTTDLLNSIISGRYQLTNNAINAVRVIYSSGNISSGTVYLYGVRKT